MSAAKDLFRIITTGPTVWTMTSGDEEVDYASGDEGEMEHYVPTPMGRGGVQLKNELTKANMDVRIPLDHPLAVLLLGSWLETLTTVTVFRQRISGTSVIWKGRLTACVPDDTFAKLVFESIYTSMRRPGLRARYQKSCRHPLYGRGCWLNAEDFAQVATMTAVGVDGRTISSPEAALQADGFFTGGMVKAPDGTLTYIAAHEGTDLLLNRLSAGLAAAFSETGPGTPITLYPGCDHSYATCESKFANDDNYGGFDHIPEKNPMAGSSIV